jgi:hypothetical protein
MPFLGRASPGGGPGGDDPLGSITRGALCFGCCFGFFKLILQGIEGIDRMG